MNCLLPNRVAIAALAALALFACAGHAQVKDISGTIISTMTILDDSQLVGDVTCAVPLTVTGANPCITFGADHIKLRLNGHTITGPVTPPMGCSLPSDSKFGVGVLVEGNTDVEIEGPGDAAVMKVREKLGLGGLTLLKASYVAMLSAHLQERGESASEILLPS